MWNTFARQPCTMAVCLVTCNNGSVYSSPYQPQSSAGGTPVATNCHYKINLRIILCILLTLQLFSMHLM